VARALRIRALKVPPSIILARAAQDQRLAEAFSDVSFATWPDAKAMRADLESGAVDLCIVPTNVAAALYNAGTPIRLLCVNVWGILHVLSHAPMTGAWPSLRGKKIAIPLKGNMPDTIFTTLAGRVPIDLATETTVVFLDSYLAAKDAVLSGVCDVAVLPEPVASAAAAEGAHRLLDLQQEWATLTGRAARFPQAGTVVPQNLTDAETGLLLTVMEDALAWMDANPDDAGALGAPLLGLDAAIIADSLRATNWLSVPGAEARDDLEFFYQTLLDASPDLVKGGQPGDGFYVARS
jgi:NitT/TauT family transport system substrate-binding protein